MFKYLEIHNQNDLAFDTCYQDVTYDQDTESKIRVMKDLYVDAVGELPPNAPKPRGQSININCFVDYDQANDRVTRCSQTGIILYFNRAPIILYYRQKNNLKSSTFCS